MNRFSIIGTGRAGGSLLRALEDVGWSLVRSYQRGDAVADAAQGVDVCFIATPDATIREVAEAISPGAALIVHLSGVTPIGVLDCHQRFGGLHPLVALPDEERGSRALRDAWFGIGSPRGDALLEQIADDLSGKWFSLDDDRRDLYHATAVVASNHVVALLAQVERLAENLGVPSEPFVDLALGSVLSLIHI